jgi:hypothetical protein
VKHNVLGWKKILLLYYRQDHIKTFPNVSLWITFFKFTTPLQIIFFLILKYFFK